jgi:hypothetical protein
LQLGGDAIRPSRRGSGARRGPRCRLTNGGRWQRRRSKGCGHWPRTFRRRPYTKDSFTAFRDQANLAQDALQAAEDASRQAREERIATVGALPMVGLQIPGAPSIVVPSEQFKSDCREGVQALIEEILTRGATARAAATRAAARAAQEGAGARVSQAATQPGTMPPPPAPMRTVAMPATPAGQQPARGAGGSKIGPTTVTRFEPRRPQGLAPPPRPAGPAPVTRSSSRVEFNAQMSHEDILKNLKQLLANQFREPPEVTAEFADRCLAPSEESELTIARRYLQRILTNEDLDVGFFMDREQSMHNLRGLWRPLRKKQHERRPPHERPGLTQPPLPVPEWEEQLDALRGWNLLG